MRLKNVPRAREIIEQSPYVIDQPACLQGLWRTLLSPECQLHVEIGMGKGKFLMELAARNPDTLYLGIEKYSSVLIRAVEKLEETPLPNVRLLCFDAENLEEIFSSEEIDRIYLNFSDPWPKARHAKRRLTSPQFLARYEKVLKKDGQIELKTDNQDLFSFSLESVEESGWVLVDKTRDLHATPGLMCGNVMTEYEEKFSQAGNPIAKMIIRQK